MQNEELIFHGLSSCAMDDFHELGEHIFLQILRSEYFSFALCGHSWRNFEHQMIPKVASEGLILPIGSTSIDFREKFFVCKFSQPRCKDSATIASIKKRHFQSYEKYTLEGEGV